MSLIDKQGAHLRPQDEMSFVVQSDHSLKILLSQRSKETKHLILKFDEIDLQEETSQLTLKKKKKKKRQTNKQNKTKKPHITTSTATRFHHFVDLHLADWSFLLK